MTIKYDLNVSRETFSKLEAFADLVRKWNPKINLVSKNSLDDLWQRHILDSVQVFELAEGEGHWVDLGSGGGFPGIVVAILNQEAQTFQVTMVESDQRKCAFLRTAIRELGLTALVKTERIEQLDGLKADLADCRATVVRDGCLCGGSNAGACAAGVADRTGFSVDRTDL